MGSSYAIHDETTGEILHVIIGSADLVAANLDTGQAALDVDGVLPAGDFKYIVDPGGTPTLDDRPELSSSIPSSVLEGDPLTITNLPDGVTITVTSTGGGGGTHPVSGIHSSLDISISGAVDGDLLNVSITGFPYIPVTGECLVVGV